MPETCPDCKVEMREEIRKCFGNPVKMDVAVPVEVCPSCGFSVVSEEHLGAIKKALKKEKTKC